MAYPWIKTFHLLFVLGWMASVFYLPRILVNLSEVGAERQSDGQTDGQSDNRSDRSAEATGQDAVQARLILMGRRLYRFGHTMFGLALILGMVLWLYFGISGPWLHAKLSLVALLLVHFVWTGRMLKRVASGTPPWPSRRLRWFNELPVLLTVAVLYLVLAKPI
ncbi:MAG: CopD family protein [Myxococcota bacterium]